VDTLWDALCSSAQRAPDAIAVQCGQDALTFESWVVQADALAHRLAACGDVGRPIGISVSHDRWVSFAIAYVAAQLAGGIPVCIRSDATPRDWELMCRESDVSLVVSTAPGDAQRPSPRQLTLEEILAAEPVDRLPAINETADAVFTSGTLGVPKAVASLHSELLSGGRLPPGWRGKTLAHTMPPYSAGGVHGALRLAMMSAIGAATPSPLSIWNPGELVRLLERPSTVALYTSPQFLRSLAGELADPSVASFDHVRMVIATGAACDEQTMKDAAAVFERASLVNIYGSTEAGMAQTFMVYDQRRPSAVGRSLGRTQVRILDDDGRPLADAGHTGEIALRRIGAPQRRYVSSEEEDGAFTGDGWVRTGDVGYLDAEGYLYIVDRKKEIAIRGSENISMRQIEDAMLGHPDVSDVGVVAVPSTDGNDRIVAFVVGRTMAGQDLRDLVRTHLSSPSAVPRTIHFIEQIPRTFLGKIDKRELRARALSLLSTAEAGRGP
jgi:acyl-CoA synthetase (AMP-forming)/AMP-acid ligase II